MATTVAGRVGAGLLAWVLGLGAAATVAHPESCPAPSAAADRAAVADAVDWLGRNQAPDGRLLYRYDRRTREVVPGYVEARHAGTVLALEQAATAGFPGAAATADRAIAWALDHLTRLPGDRLALTGDTGASALLVVALVERRARAGDPVHDHALRALGRFVEGAVTPAGAVVATWDLTADEPVPGSRSPFFTGEVLDALAHLHSTFPGEGWDGPARRVARYLATRRDDAERRLPPVSDHWGAYALAEMARWPGGAGLPDEDLAYARRQAGLFGLQARFESQRRDHGLARLTRGPEALPAGIGTVGEGLGAIRRLQADDPRLALDPATVDRRLTCVAGLLVARQVHSRDPLADGAWFRGDQTQVDDQQHAVSALLSALPALEAR